MRCATWSGVGPNGDGLSTPHLGCPRQTSHNVPTHPLEPYYFIPLPAQAYFTAPLPSWIRCLPCEAEDIASVRPIAVHCHGGVGRTGVAILSHMYLRKILTGFLLGDGKEWCDSKMMSLLSQLFRVRLQRDSVQGPRQLAYIFHFVHCLLSLNRKPNTPNLPTFPSYLSLSLIHCHLTEDHLYAGYYLLLCDR